MLSGTWPMKRGSWNRQWLRVESPPSLSPGEMTSTMQTQNIKKALHSQSCIQGEHLCLGVAVRNCCLLLARPRNRHECSITQHAQDTTWRLLRNVSVARTWSVLEQTQLACVNLITNVTELSILLREMSATIQTCQPLAANSVPFCHSSCKCANVCSLSTKCHADEFRLHIGIYIRPCADKGPFTNFLKIPALDMMIVNAQRGRLLKLRHRFRFQIIISFHTFFLRPHLTLQFCASFQLFWSCLGRLFLFCDCMSSFLDRSVVLDLQVRSSFAILPTSDGSFLCDPLSRCNHRSQADDLMEWLFNPTLNRTSAEVCAVRQMCVSGNNDDSGARKVRVRMCIFAHLPFGWPLADCQVEKEEQKQILHYLIGTAATSRPDR